MRFQNSPTGILGTLENSAVAFEAVIKAINESPLNRGLSGADWVSDPANIAIVQGDDIALFDGTPDCADFEFHVLFMSRGQAAIDAGRAALRRMFLEFGAETIYGMVPDFRRDVKFFARWCGMKSVGIRQTKFGPCELFVIWKGAMQ